MYLDYTTYKKIGGELSETAFNRIIIKAESKIDTVTFDRLKQLQKIPEAVQHCLRDIVDIFDKMENLSTQNDDNVSSWSNDGVSVSYGQLKKDEYNQMIDETIRNYLLGETTEDGTPLLYCGVN